MILLEHTNVIRPLLGKPITIKSSDFLEEGFWIICAVDGLYYGIQIIGLFEQFKA